LSALTMSFLGMRRFARSIHHHRSEDPDDMTGHAGVDLSPPDDRSAAQSTPVTVVGLGPMGTALARALLAAGVPTTVWNRSPSRARPLADEGATVAATLPSAVAAGPLVVACLRDHDAFRQAFGAVDDQAFSGRTVVHLSSATPAQARETAHWAAQRGIRYLNGAIMVPTPLIGTPESLLLYSGPTSVFDVSRAHLAPLGRADHLGEDPGLASLFDVAMLEVFFAGMTSFLHAAAMMTANGISARTFLPYAERVVAILPGTLAGLARDVDDRSHPGDEDDLAMEAAALDHIVAAAADSGTDSRLAVVMRDLARRAVGAGHGADGFSRLVDHLRAG
jgi:3-hydroxyisobutyrate dehydrogenase-like beta-hydroxyacid dehydrogenase